MTAPTETSHAVVGLSFDAERLEARRKTLGASEIPAVAGLSSYKTPLDVYLEKRGLAESFTGSEFTEWGLRLENVVAEKYGEMMGVMLKTSETLVGVTEPWMSATPDRFVFLDMASGPSHGLEIKNKGARQIVNWGDSGTDAVPHDIAAQCHWSMLVTGLRIWDVAVLFGGNTFRWYRLEYDDAIASALMERGRDFWINHVLAGVEPPIDGSKAAGEYLKKRFAKHTDVLRDATREEEQIIRELAGAKEKAKAADAEQSLIENKIKMAIGANAGIMSRSGRVTWKAPKPTPETDYAALAGKLLTLVPEPDREPMIESFTTEKANSRRLLLTIPKE